MKSNDAAYFQQRITLFQSTLSAQQAVFISSANDIRYFTNFEFLVPEEREAFLLITPSSACVIISAFSPAPELHFLTVLRGTRPAVVAEHILKIATELQLKLLSFQDFSLFVIEFSALHTVLKDIVKLEPLSPQAVWKQRMIKDELELQDLKKAGKIVARAAREIEGFFKVGVTELELSDQLATLFKKNGANGLGFPTIVAFGDHGTSPHHQPGPTSLTENTAILIDCGAMVNGYRSDLTRTWWFGSEVPEEFTVIKGVVTAAYELAVAELSKKSADLTAKKIDDVTRTFITREGYGPQFIHTTGHGVGLDIHEPPSLSWGDSTALKPGMIITIEPGIYLDKKFGYRYENTLLVTETGAENVTDFN